MDRLAGTADGEGLLDLHRELVTSHLDDPGVVRDLLPRVKVQRRALRDRTRAFEEDIKEIHDLLLSQYASGSVSVDDWLN